MPASKDEKAAAIATAAPTAIPPAPKRLAHKAFMGAEFSQPIWVVTPDGETTFEDVLTREYWAHVARKLTPDAIILVKPEKRDYFAELIVDAAGSNWASVEVLRKVDRSGDAEDIRSDEFAVKWMGPAVKFCVIRRSTGERVSQDHGKKQDAWAWLAENESRLANAS